MTRLEVWHLIQGRAKRERDDSDDGFCWKHASGHFSLVLRSSSPIFGSGDALNCLHRFRLNRDTLAEGNSRFRYNSCSVSAPRWSSMRFDILTIFPGFFDGPLDYGILKRARTGGQVEVVTHDLRSFTHDRHRTVDDRPFGGGEGMVLKAEPIFDAFESLGMAAKAERDTSRETVILLSAQGRPFNQTLAHELARMERVVILCGRYEGVDERVNELLCDQEISIGDYVLSGGELAAAVVIDAVVRLLPGALGNPDSARFESFGAGPRRRGMRRSWMGCRGRLMRLRGCWIIRTTLGRRSFVGWGFLRL